ncbi:uncharacterized protein [Coffea arabica]|uniref:Reverse transcriptase domain-containing protein n=1 Tax=Coffea arabica TaxID=13443 RepID=A0A6P6TEW5_COFAR|nr:uncharacterized protein LOC113700746 [Coffea arabica]
MAENSQQFGFRESNPTRRVNEVESTSIQQQLSELTSVVRQLAVGNVPQVKACGICTNMGHPTDSCPILQENGAEQVNMAGGVPAPHRQYDPYSNTYNPGWRDHPNFSYGNRPQNAFSNRPPGFQQPWQSKPQPSSSNSGSFLEDIVKSLATTTAQLQQETRSLTTNMAQLQQETRALTMSTTQFQQDTKAGMKDMEARISQMATAINRLESYAYGKLPSQPEVNPRNVSAMTLRSGKEVDGPKLINSKSKSEEEIKKEIEEEGRIREEAKVPKYAKFLKDLCVNKRKLRGDERVMVGENVSAVLQRKLPPKCGDPRPLKETGIIIQLADRTCAYPDGIVEDVLVQVDGLIFHADFYVLYMDDRSTPNPSPIILGRPFFSTAQTKIDVSKEFSKFAYRGKFKVAANKSYRMKAIHEVRALEARMVNVDANVAGIAQNLAQFLHHTGFPPPAAPRPPL